MLKQLKWSSVLIALGYIVTGILLIVFPDVSADVISWIIGIAAIAVGIVELITYFLLDVQASFYHNEFVIGVLCIVFGLIVLMKREIIMNLVPIILGLIIIGSGILKVQNAVVAKRIHYDRSSLYLILGIIGIVLGIVIMFFMSGKTAQDLLFITIGVALIYDGGSDLFATLFLANKFAKLQKAFVAEQNGDVIDAEVEDSKEEKEDSDHQ